MAKKIKQITLDEEIIDYLNDEVNASGLINKLLKDYYGKGEDMKRENLVSKISEIVEEMKEKKRQLDNLKSTLENFDKKIKEREEKFKSIPQEILRDMSRFNFTENSLLTRYKEVYIKKYTYTFKEIKNLWKDFKEYTEQKI